MIATIEVGYNEQWTIETNEFVTSQIFTKLFAIRKRWTYQLDVFVD